MGTLPQFDTGRPLVNEARKFLQELPAASLGADGLVSGEHTTGWYVIPAGQSRGTVLVSYAVDGQHISQTGDLTALEDIRARFEADPDWETEPITQGVFWAHHLPSSGQA